MFEISDEHIEEIFVNEIKPRLVNDSEQVGLVDADKVPTLVVVGSQPGSGKVWSCEAAMAEFEDLTYVNGDDLRSFHPDYSRMCDHAPLFMPAHTAKASGAWIKMSLDYLLQCGRGVLLETTFRQAEILETTFRRFKQAGYQTELRVVAVAPEVTLGSTLIRFAGKDIGRWTPSDIHDAAAFEVPLTVSRLVKTGELDRVVVVQRDGKAMLRLELSPGILDDAAASVQNILCLGRNLKSVPVEDLRAIVKDLSAAISTAKSYLRKRSDESGELNKDLEALIQRIEEKDLRHLLAELEIRELDFV